MTPINERGRQFLAEGIVEKLHGSQIVLVGDRGQQIGQQQILMASAWDFDLHGDAVLFYHPELIWEFERGAKDAHGWQLWRGGIIYAADFPEPLSLSAPGSAVKLRPTMQLTFKCEEIS